MIVNVPFIIFAEMKERSVRKHIWNTGLNAMRRKIC